MGVDRTDYVIVGVNVPYDDFYAGVSHPNDGDGMDHYEKYCEPYVDDSHKSEIHERDGLTMIFDGMNGKYVIVGRVLAKARASHGEGLPMIDCSLPPESEVKLLSALIGKCFPFLDMAHYPIRVWALAHYH